MQIPERHYVNGNPMSPPFPQGLGQALVAMGCFWGAERRFWQTDGIYSTAVGYAGGEIPAPSYEAVCSGTTGHAEVVRLIFDPQVITYTQLLKLFWESHDPTQGMRQGADIGSQYRSGIYTYSVQQKATASHTRQRYQAQLSARGFGTITTEILDAPEFYYAEAYHQQYLAKNTSGYCGLGGTEVVYLVGQ